jgi:acyl dehydratase
MALDPEKLMALELPVVRQSYDWRDCIIYSLGLGMGLDPLDEGQLKYVDETKLVAAPTMANVLGYPGFWMRDMDSGIDWVRVVHGEQALTVHKALPTKGTVVGRSRIVDLVDKGEGKGAVVLVERAIEDEATGDLLATIVQTVFCRGDGGFGGKRESARKSSPLPERAPDRSTNLATHAQLALIYRLSGDYNPLHSDPATARKAGFDRPILHGLATFGIAGAGLIEMCCGGDPARFTSLDARFSAPVFPGEEIVLDIWDLEAGAAAFRAHIPQRDATVLTNGRFTYVTD